MASDALSAFNDWELERRRLRIAAAGAAPSPALEESE
jgi:hypothetical protein